MVGAGGGLPPDDGSSGPVASAERQILGNRHVAIQRSVLGGGTYSVTYDNYSDDGKTFISGTEKVTVVNPIGNATWTADLTSTGERTGYLKGSIKAGKANAFSGTVSSEINGVTYTGVPIQTDFPVINPPPQLAITSFDNSPGDRHRRRGRLSPPSGVRRNGDCRFRDNDHRRARLCQIPFRPGDTITVDAGGFLSASQQVN